MSKMLFYNELKVHALEIQEKNLVCAIDSPRIFKKFDFVYKLVQSRARAKNESIFTGPHMILDKLGDYTYNVTSHTTKSTITKVNVSDIKPFIVPDTSTWQLNSKYFDWIREEMRFPASVQLQNIVIDFCNLDKLTLQFIEKAPPQCFIIPDWPCAPWYRPLHRLIKAKAVLLPNFLDLFLDSSNNPLGTFSWKNWIFFTESFLYEVSSK
jgi:hypothetical protein